jgi:predicted membrane protein
LISSFLFIFLFILHSSYLILLFYILNFWRLIKKSLLEKVRHRKQQKTRGGSNVLQTKKEQMMKMKKCMEQIFQWKIILTRYWYTFSTDF